MEPTSEPLDRLLTDLIGARVTPVHLEIWDRLGRDYGSTERDLEVKRQIGKGHRTLDAVKRALETTENPPQTVNRVTRCLPCKKEIEPGHGKMCSDCNQWIGPECWSQHFAACGVRWERRHAVACARTPDATFERLLKGEDHGILGPARKARYSPEFIRRFWDKVLWGRFKLGLFHEIPDPWEGMAVQAKPQAIEEPVPLGPSDYAAGAGLDSDLPF